MNRLLNPLLSAVVVYFSLLSMPALADRHDEHWYHGNIHEFHDRDLHAWRGGRWFHGYYGGHYGWWWIVGGAYYWYPAAVYPYPDPYSPPAALLAPVPAVPQPPQAVFAPAPAVPQQPPAVSQPSDAPQMWYYCDSAKSYYPYVATCPGGWRAVPANPAGAPHS
jgi:hypothetical protein